MHPLQEFFHAHRSLPRMGYAVIATLLLSSTATILISALLSAEHTGYYGLVWMLAQIPPLLVLLLWIGTKRPEVPWEEFRTCLGLILPAVVAFELCFWVQLYFEIKPQITATAMLEEAAEHQTQVWVPWVSALVLAPIREEILFRGILLWGAIKTGCPPFLAVVLQAALFALVHGDWAYLPSYLLSGVVFGLVSLTRVGLWGAMLLHAATNAWVFWVSS